MTRPIAALSRASRAGTGLALALASVSAAASGGLQTVGPPAGFEQLAGPRTQVVDLYFGGQLLGSTRAVTTPGELAFDDPAEVVGLLPHVTLIEELTTALSAALPSNSALACTRSNQHACGKLLPDAVGIIHDENRFAVHLFVAPRFLATQGRSSPGQLDFSSTPPSATSAAGLAISGSDDGPAVYNLQNRLVAGLDNTRVRLNHSFASELGYIVDDLVLERDEEDLRYSAGLYWAPGVELVGDRRILGVGLGTQLDTRLDRDNLQASPIPLLLSQQSRVDILSDGRLLASGVYDAGSHFLDTGLLPSGSYPVTLRIHEANGQVREEQSFLIKTDRLPPLGRPLFSANLGLLATTRGNRPVSVSDTLYYQLGAARRFSEKVAGDLNLLGTQRTAMIQGGATLITRHATGRLAALASSRGDKGVLLNVSTNGRTRWNATFDLRRVWNSSDQPLLPVSTSSSSFNGKLPRVLTNSNGSYAQVTGSLGYSLGAASIALLGTYRKSGSTDADYSVGGDVRWRIANLAQWQVMLQADAQITPTGRSSYIGAQIVWRGGGVSMFGSGGRRSRSLGKHSKRTRQVWSTSAHYSSPLGEWGQMDVQSGVERDVATTNAHFSGFTSTQWGNARADFVQQIEGGSRSQYGLTLQSGAAIVAGKAGFTGKGMTESAVIVSVDTPVRDADFDLLVDGQVRARLHGRTSTTIFLEPYREYSVRLRPASAANLHLDLDHRRLALYPGSVHQLRWQTEDRVTVFGQAVLANGEVLSNAEITSTAGIGRTDDNGYFQIETSQQDLLKFRRGNVACEVRLPGIERSADYARVGRLTCR